MLLDLGEIRGSENRVDRTYSVGELRSEVDDAYRVNAPVALQARLLKDGDKFRLTGRVDTTLQLACCRCLEPFDRVVGLLIDLLYLPQDLNDGEDESEISAEDLSTAFYRDEQIDLDALVREQFQLALPMKPLCGDDCRGLCAQCGINLNTGRCSCETGWRDPRLAALESLLSKGRKG
jgi:uncharacterized protein